MGLSVCTFVDLKKMKINSARDGFVSFFSKAMLVLMALLVTVTFSSAAHALTWTSRTSAADNAWRDVTYGNGLFVAVAYAAGGNNVMTSPDGITWTLRTSPSKNWQSVTYGNGLYVAVANGFVTDSVMTSPDGITWTSRTAFNDAQRNLW